MFSGVGGDPVDSEVPIYGDFVNLEDLPAQSSKGLKVIGCSSLRGGEGELGNLKSLIYGSNYFAHKFKLKYAI